MHARQHSKKCSLVVSRLSSSRAECRFVLAGMRKPAIVAEISCGCRFLYTSHVAWSVCRAGVLGKLVSCAKRLNRSRCRLERPVWAHRTRSRFIHVIAKFHYTDTDTDPNGPARTQRSFAAKKSVSVSVSGPCRARVRVRVVEFSYKSAILWDGLQGCKSG